MKRWRLIAGLFAYRQTFKAAQWLKLTPNRHCFIYKVMVRFYMAEIEDLQKKYSELENKYRDSIRENNSLSEKIKEQTTLMMQLRIDLVAEMKMAKMMFEMVLADGHTHKAKEWIAKLSNHVLDLNINKAEQSIIRKMDYDDGLPF